MFNLKEKNLKEYLKQQSFQQWNSKFAITIIIFPILLSYNISCWNDK